MEATDNRQDNVPANQQKEQNVGKKKRINQLVFIEYENSKPNGHLITVQDSYRNVLGRIHEQYDEQQDKFIYTFIDYEGSERFIKDDLGKLKQEISENKTPMMEQAHKRRIDRNLVKYSTPYSPNRKKGKSTVREMEKGVETVVEKTLNESREVLGTLSDFAAGEDREAEMREIRARKQDRSRGISR